MNFATLQGLTIPEGVVTQITDASGRVLWALQDDVPIVLEVAKITSDTYAGSTTYSGEQFVLLDIYPKTASSKVNVTYGGLTKTLAFSGTNAQQVYFGTFYGVADEVETPASGELIIAGGCVAFAIGVYNKPGLSSGKSATAYCSCITDVQSWGGVTTIPQYAFYQCTALALTELPNGITSIGDYAFCECNGNRFTHWPSALKTIGERAFQGYYFEYLPREIPEGVVSIGAYAFYDPLGMTSSSDAIEMTLPSTLKTIGDYAFMTPYWEDRACFLRTIKILATIPPSAGTFGDITFMREVIVPAGCGEAYKAAWREFADVIVEAS